MSRNKLPYLVLDTNILLIDHTNVVTLGQQNIVVLPETTIAELDHFKTNMGELGYQARAFSRLISSAKRKGINTEEIVLNGTTPTIITAKLEIEGVEVLLASTPKYPYQNYTNDQKIIYIAELMVALGETIFMTNDINCSFQAQARGLNVIDFKTVEKVQFEFTKTLEVSPTIFSLLHNKAIKEVDKNYKPENFNYVFKCAGIDQTKIGIVHNGIIDIVGKTTEKELRDQPVNPIGAEQLLFSKAIRHPDINLILCEARAGTGKTLLALSNAMKLVKGNNNYSNIVYVRASIDDVDKAEEVGFLAGNDEKFAVYFHPLTDAIEHIVRAKLAKRKELKGDMLETAVKAGIEETRDKFHITTLTGLGMRGRTIPNTILIIDEIQGQSKSSVQKMLTRIGKDCKVIIIGSQKQIDNSYVTKFNNGFSVLLNETTKPQSLIKIHAISLSKVVRSPLSDWAEIVFSKDLQD